MYPKLLIDLKRIKSNLNRMIEMVHNAGCSIMVVTKGYSADLEIFKIIENSYVDYVADSRILNLKKYDTKKLKVLLRLPMISEAEETVRYSDISLNSEIATIKILNEEAKKQNKIHKILLMIDLGDLREGIFYKNEEEIYYVTEEILKLENIELLGIGANLTCYGAVIPQKENLSLLIEIKEKIENKFNIKLKIISGGNSSSIHLIKKNDIPNGINNLRIGEAFLLGSETAYCEKLEGFYDDAFILEAEIVELKEKPSFPIGEIGQDAFGIKPIYEDKGIIKRCILAIGKQDIDPDNIIPLDKNIKILGASSDHLILNLTDCNKNYYVGDTVQFKLKYSSLLRASTSIYVNKEYKI